MAWAGVIDSLQHASASLSQLDSMELAIRPQAIEIRDATMEEESLYQSYEARRANLGRSRLGPSHEATGQTLDSVLTQTEQLIEAHGFHDSSEQLRTLRSRAAGLRTRLRTLKRAMRKYQGSRREQTVGQRQLEQEGDLQADAEARQAEIDRLSAALDEAKDRLEADEHRAAQLRADAAEAASGSIQDRLVAGQERRRRAVAQVEALGDAVDHVARQLQDAEQVIRQLSSAEQPGKSGSKRRRKGGEVAGMEDEEDGEKEEEEGEDDGEEEEEEETPQQRERREREAQSCALMEVEIKQLEQEEQTLQREADDLEAVVRSAGSTDQAAEVARAEKRVDSELAATEADGEAALAEAERHAEARRWISETLARFVEHSATAGNVRGTLLHVLKRSGGELPMAELRQEATSSLEASGGSAEGITAAIYKLVGQRYLRMDRSKPETPVTLLL